MPGTALPIEAGTLGEMVNIPARAILVTATSSLFERSVRVYGWRFMENNTPPPNHLNAAATSRCWVARAGTERRPWSHPYWPYVTAAPEPGAVAQNRPDSPSETGSADSDEANEQELR